MKLINNPFKIWILTAAWLAFPFLSNADVLFSDGFEDDALGSESTSVSLINWDQASSNREFAVNTFANSGSKSVFMRDGARSITQKTAVDITGTSSLVVSWWMRQGANAWETDTFTFEIDFGSGFQTVLTDSGLADGGDYTYSGTSNTLAAGSGNATSFQAYTVTIDSSYYNGTIISSDIKLKFSHNTGSNDEDTYLDDIAITAVPEPGALTLLLIGFTGLMIYRRKH